MTKDEICATYQNLLREAYPRVVVKPSTNEWNPYKDECYLAFFVPDSAAGAHYFEQWHREGGWYDRLEQQKIPLITLMPIYDSQVTKDDLLKIGKATATAGHRKASSTPRRGKAKPARVRANAS
jgi:hypothetical protein